MVTQAVVFALMVSVVNCYYLGSGYYGGYPGYHAFPYMHHDYSHHAADDAKQKFCDRNNPCPDNGVCCLKGFQGRCYYGSYSSYYGYKRKDPEVSETCIKDWGAEGLGAKCSTDLECGSGRVCEELTSNKWGVCKQHICFDTDRTNPCNGGWCWPIKRPGANGKPEYNTPEYTCDCFKDSQGDKLTKMADWKIGKYCEKPHPCADEKVHLCGDNGECERDPNDAEKMVCKCKTEWYGEKCNHAGACMQPYNTCLNTVNGGKWVPRDNGAVCVSLSATPNDHKCDCSNVPENAGANCETNACNSGQGCQNNGICVSSGGSFDDSNIFQKNGHCECKFNYYGEACENSCGGNSLMSDSTLQKIEGSDAVCIYKDVACGATTDTVKIMIDETDGGDTSLDPYCHKYYFEVYSQTTDVGRKLHKSQIPTSEGVVDANGRRRYCKGAWKDDGFTWEFAAPCEDSTKPLYIIMSLKEGQSFNVVTET